MIPLNKSIINTLLAVTLLNSCTLQKHRYNNGYRLNWHKLTTNNVGVTNTPTLAKITINKDDDVMDDTLIQASLLTTVNSKLANTILATTPNITAKLIAVNKKHTIKKQVKTTQLITIKKQYKKGIADFGSGGGDLTPLLSIITVTFIISFLIAILLKKLLTKNTKLSKSSINEISWVTFVLLTIIILVIGIMIVT